MAKKKKSYKTDGQGLRNVNIMAAAASGKTQTEIAEEFGLSRGHVNTILRSDEAKRLVDQARSGLMTYADVAVETLVAAMLDKDKNMPCAVNAATTILKGIGVLTEKSEVTVNRPFIMKLLDGSEIHMGLKGEKE